MFNQVQKSSSQNERSNSSSNKQSFSNQKQDQNNSSEAFTPLEVKKKSHQNTKLINSFGYYTNSQSKSGGSLQKNSDFSGDKTEIANKQSTDCTSFEIETPSTIQKKMNQFKQKSSFFQTQINNAAIEVPQEEQEIKQKSEKPTKKIKVVKIQESDGKDIVKVIPFSDWIYLVLDKQGNLTTFQIDQNKKESKILKQYIIGSKQTNNVFKISQKNVAIILTGEIKIVDIFKGLQIASYTLENQKFDSNSIFVKDLNILAVGIQKQPSILFYQIETSVATILDLSDSQQVQQIKCQEENSQIQDQDQNNIVGQIINLLEIEDSLLVLTSQQFIFKLSLKNLNFQAENKINKQDKQFKTSFSIKRK